MEGTNTLTLTVPYSTILDRVKSSSYYSGEAAKGDLQEVAALLQASSDDDIVLTDYVKEAATKVTNVMQRYLGRTQLEICEYHEYPAFNAQVNYDLGAIVTYNERIYQAKQAIYAPSLPPTASADDWEDITYKNVDGVLFTTLAPVNFPATATYPDAIADAVADYLTDYVMREWMKPIPATSQYFDGKTKEDAQVIREFCSHRGKPTRQ